MDPLDKARDQMGAVEKTVYGLPGVKGYREREMRRDADKQVRERLAEELSTRRVRISNLQQELLAGGGLMWMDDVERVVGRLQLLIDRIRTAAYGYAGWFDLQRIREAELDRLAEYDRALFDGLGGLDSAIGDLEKAVHANDNIQGALQALATLLSDMNDKFSRRLEAITAE